MELAGLNGDKIITGMSALKTIAIGVASVAGVSLLAGAGWVGYRIWPRPLPARDATFPVLKLDADRVALRATPDALVAKVATFRHAVTAYLKYEYLCTAPQTGGREIFLVREKGPQGPEFHLYVLLDNDLLRALPYLETLKGAHLIPAFEMQDRASGEILAWEAERHQWEAAYHAPVRHRLETLDAKQLLPQMVRFLKFKSETDPRVMAGIEPVFLSDHQADVLAKDILTVAHFYDLPLDYFLGIAAMENNYMNVNGDLGHTVWKRRAQRGDIVLRRWRHHVLVLNYSIGVWQITRETLRHAQRLFLKDTRDYSKLPPRLRPPRHLNPDTVNLAVLTTYAGLLFRNLLDQFHGDVGLAAGAYNGGKNSPNLVYADGVARVAAYARRILEHAVPDNDVEPVPSIAPPNVILSLVTREIPFTTSASDPPPPATR